MSPRERSALQWNLMDELLAACERAQVPMEALHRLTSSEGGRRTMDDCMQRIIADWRTEQLSMGTTHTFRTTPLIGMRDIVLVPDLPATELIELVRAECGLTSLDHDYARWNFYQGARGREIPGRGKRFEFLTWQSESDVEMAEVQEYFSERGFVGHAGAFTAWIGEHKHEGRYASVESGRGWHHMRGYHCVPSAVFEGKKREMKLLPSGGRPLSKEWVFVGARQLFV